MRKFLLTMLALLVVAALPVRAGGGEKGDWEFGPYAGYGWLDDYRALNPDNDALFGVRAAYFITDRYSVDGSLQQLSTTTSFPASAGIEDVDMDIDSIRVNFLYNFRPGASLRPFVTAGMGGERTELKDLGQSTDMGVNAGGGLRWYITHSFGLRLDARYVYTDVSDEVHQAQKNLEGTIGVLWSFGGGPPPDADNDGVPDRKDKCPDTPVGARVDLTGCPSDQDGDGVFDGIDQCSDTPAGWPVDEKGCPTDKDGDGVPDGKDTCADTPKGATVDEKGCPSDSDGDGVLDGLDRCADTPKGAKVDDKGCPIDSDHDGVFDGLDDCPDTPHGTEVDEKGCPIVVKAPPLFEMEKKKLVLEGVNFETNMAEITAESAPVLDAVAASLNDWPEVRVEIGGHTDSSGSRSHNLDLSQRRADAVKAYLVARGVEESRLMAKGYGEGSPIADNNTSEGKAKNRRVELTRLD